jgi:hypothetical protein
MLSYAKPLFAALSISLLPLPTTVTPEAVRLDGYVVSMTVAVNTKEANAPIGMTLKLAGDKMRMEMDVSSMLGSAGGGEAATMMNGAYMLAQSDGRIAMVLPNMRNPFGGGATGMGMIIDSEMIKGQIRESADSIAKAPSEVTVTMDDLGPGETILGHATRRYRLTHRLTMGGQQEGGTAEVWMASDLAEAEAGFRKFGEAFGKSLLGGSSVDVENAIFAKMPTGFALRIVATSGTETIKMEVTKAQKTSMDASEFEVPSGIQLMDIGAMLGGRGK